MLKRLEEQNFERYAEFAYELALDMTKSGYPTYADGVKTKEDFMERSRKAFSRENEEILLFERDGKATGWIHYYHLPEDHYLDTCSFCIAEGMGEAIEEFMAFAREKFPGCELYLGFPEANRDAVTALIAGGFACIEESYNDILDFASYKLRPESENVAPITKENYGPFGELHAQHKDMYWNSERILNAIDEWNIFALLRNGKATGAVYLRKDESTPEIFGIDFEDGVYDSAVYRSLLTAMLNDCKRQGAQHLFFFNDEDSQSDALVCGFRCVGKYVCYKTAL